MVLGFSEGRRKGKKLLNDEAPLRLGLSAPQLPSRRCLCVERKRSSKEGVPLHVWMCEKTTRHYIRSFPRPVRDVWQKQVAHNVLRAEKRFTYGRNSFVGQTSFFCTDTANLDGGKLNVIRIVGNLCHWHSDPCWPIVGPDHDPGKKATPDLSNRLRAPSDSSRQIGYLERNGEKYIFLLPPGTLSRIFSTRRLQLSEQLNL